MEPEPPVCEGLPAWLVPPVATWLAPPVAALPPAVAEPPVVTVVAEPPVSAVEPPVPTLAPPELTLPPEPLGAGSLGAWPAQPMLIEQKLSASKRRKEIM